MLPQSSPRRVRACGSRGRALENTWQSSQRRWPFIAVLRFFSRTIRKVRGPAYLGRVADLRLRYRRKDEAINITAPRRPFPSAALLAPTLSFFFENSTTVYDHPPMTANPTDTFAPPTLNAPDESAVYRQARRQLVEALREATTASVHHVVVFQRNIEMLLETSASIEQAAATAHRLVEPENGPTAPAS